jgi:hypothetical protein
MKHQGASHALQMVRRGRGGALHTTAAITQPAEEGGQTAWRRMVGDGVEQASDLWAGVNSAAAAKAKGTWEGIKPIKKVRSLKPWNSQTLKPSQPSSPQAFNFEPRTPKSRTTVYHR